MGHKAKDQHFFDADALAGDDAADENEVTLVEGEDPHRYQDAFEDPIGNSIDLFEPGSDKSPAADGNAQLVHDVADAMADLAVAGNQPSLLLQQSQSEVDSFHARAQIAEEMFALVLSTLPFQALTDKLLKLMVSCLGASAGSILEVDQVEREFFFRSVLGSQAETVKQFRIPCNEGIVGHVAETRESVLINDVESDERHQRAISKVAGVDVQSCLAVPIVICGNLYGVVELFNKETGGSFSEIDRKLLEDAARMAAKVLEVRFFAAEVSK